MAESWQTLIGLVRDQLLNYDFYLLNSIGHGNPGVLKKEMLSKEDAERANETLKMRILKHLKVQ